jgi:Tfp pilus assembly protein PilV
MHRLSAHGVRSRLSSDAGMGLVETLISAVILIIVIGAVLTTIDVSGRTATVNKSRSIASTLAEQDLERMRAMSPTALDGHSQSGTVEVDNVPYTIKSKSEWIDDATDTPKNCEASSNQGSYLRISSTVTSSVVGTRVKPVVMRSIVSPRADSFDEDSGTLVVKVTDHEAKPVRGILVTISPAAQLARATDEFGCAVFSHIPARTYTATLNTPGYVNEDAEQLHDANANVVTGQTAFLPMTYAPAARVTVNFKALPTPGTTSSAHAVTLANSKKRIVKLAPAGPTPASLTVDVFPYPEGYSAYTGRCMANSPAHTGYSPVNDPYVATKPGFTSVTAGQPIAVDALQPRANVKVTEDGTKAVNAARVVFTATDSTCGSTANGARFVRYTGTDGYVPDRGLPFGRYTVCAERVVSGWTRHEQQPYDNWDYRGSANLTLTINESDSWGSCP